MTHTQFLQAAIDELSRQHDEMIAICMAAIDREDYSECYMARRAADRISDQRLNMTCALEDLKA